MGQATRWARAIPAALVAAAALLWPGAARAMNIYDFESLSIGDLDGQDGWARLTNPDPSLYGTVRVADGSAAPNTSRLLDPDHTWGTPDIFAYARPNNPNWSFKPFTGLEREAYIQFDCVVNETSVTQWPSGTSFNVYGGGSGSPQVMACDNFGAVATAPLWRVLIFGSSGNVFHTAPIGPGASVGDWVRARLTMDFLDTSGVNDGSVSLSYRNLTTGGAWTDVALLQDLDMDLGTGDPSLWNTLIFWIDNPDSAPMQRLDNLVVGGQVPEPATLTLLALGGLGLLARRRRRKP
ncbi:MAG: PEP-CTERM sorting domain-containing protein [Phycisphaerales bacterium]|nr:MAG: PEP-CTERM sorting domain-containing protein [Phycisphaerales bacterium]